MCLGESLIFWSKGKGKIFWQIPIIFIGFGPNVSMLSSLLWVVGAPTMHHAWELRKSLSNHYFSVTGFCMEDRRLNNSMIFSWQISSNYKRTRLRVNSNVCIYTHNRSWDFSCYRQFKKDLYYYLRSNFSHLNSHVKS